MKLSELFKILINPSSLLITVFNHNDDYIYLDANIKNIDISKISDKVVDKILFIRNDEIIITLAK